MSGKQADKEAVAWWRGSMRIGGDSYPHQQGVQGGREAKPAPAMPGGGLAYPNYPTGAIYK